MTDRAMQEDEDARRLALTELDRTLLVEAGAGSGKTSVLAGRVVALLAAGRAPNTIAAITFTDLAAGELRERIDAFAHELLAGMVRPDLRAAFGAGLAAAQRDNLARGCAEFDALSCSTIHSFCQTLLTPYPVEAGADPGAAVMDRAEADALLSETVENVLRKRLARPRDERDALQTCLLADVGKTRALVTAFAGRLRARPDLRAPAPAADARDRLRAAVAAFRAFLDGAPCREPNTTAIVAGLEALVAGIAPEPDPAPAELLHLFDLPIPESCATDKGAFAAYRYKGKWRDAAKAARVAPQAERLNEEATALHAACRDAHAAVPAWAAARALQLIEVDCRAVVAAFAEAKRGSARLDFDDLMLKTRDLLRDRADVRAALAGRFAAVLVDEFQDTDPLQVEILWRLAAEPPAGEPTDWATWPVRPGALFLVGDPKQAIYRFRGADVASYEAMRDRLRAADAGAVVAITQNFRSVPGVLDWVNRHFAGPLGAPRQPGFAPLFAARGAETGDAVTALAVAVLGEGATAIRDAEAEAVADLCAALIGTRQIGEGEGARPLAADDIALLAPTGADLWRYERALEARGIPVSTQAGKGFFRRQEVHDLLALTRALADRRDRLALGALLRGPLVGLTEEALLDAAHEAGSLPDGGYLDLWTPVDALSHPVLRDVLTVLQDLARRAGSTTPHALLCAAVEAMQVRPVVRRRGPRTAERALGNVDLFLEMARPYDTRGLRAFAAAMQAQWDDETRAVEARADTARPAVSLITMHSSKGLEWPVVIPINAGTKLMDFTATAVDAAGALHMKVFGHHPEGAAAALAAERDEVERERHRLWYVAATRARDLLVLPRPSCEVKGRTWMGFVASSLADLPDIESPDRLSVAPEEPTEPTGPDAAAFAAEAAAIRAGARVVHRRTPHLSEGDEAPGAEVVVMPPDGAPDGAALPRVRGSRERGLILHKLLEEVLTGETTEDEGALAARAAALRAEMGIVSGPKPAEMAGSVLRGLAVPEVRAVRHRLVPEWPVASSRAGEAGEELTLGTADAVALGDDERVDLVVDWKSDVEPAAEAVARYRGQVRAYLDATGASEGLIVFLSSGRTVKVERILE